MRTDTIFYQIFQAFPGLLFEVVGKSPDLAKKYEFSSREIKELARTFDGIFLPVSDDPNLLIYFVEVQFQKKPDFYWRFLTEIFVYLGQYQPTQNFRAVAIFASRSLDPGVPNPCRFLEKTGLLIKVYLDELRKLPNSSLGLETVELVIGKQQTAIAQAGRLIEKAREELKEATIEQKVVELIETILIYKLPQLNRRELEAMFGLEDLKNTRYFQEVAAEFKLEGKLEGKLETVPRLLAFGLSVEQIAQALGLDIELVKLVSKKHFDTN